MRPKRGFGIELARDHAVERVGDPGDAEQHEHDPAPAIARQKERRHEHRHQHDAHDGQGIGQARHGASLQETTVGSQALPGFLQRLIRVKEIVDLPGQGRADPGHGLQIGQAGRRHRARRAEMRKQRLFAPGADAGDLVQRAGADGLGALLAMAADGEAMRLVAQALQIIENRALGIEAEGRLARR